MRPSNLVEMIIVYINKKYIASPLKRGSIAAVKAYVQLVKVARLGLLALFAFTLAAAAMVAGVVLTIVGLVGLAPLSETGMAVAILLIGLILVAITGVVFLRVFQQRMWLEVSRSYDLIEAVTDAQSARGGDTIRFKSPASAPNEASAPAAAAEPSLPFPYST